MDKEEISDSIKSYLGKDLCLIMCNMTKEEKELFKSKNIEKGKSYFVIGSEKMLKKFKAYYLSKNVQKRPIFETKMFSEYVESLSNPSISETNIFLEGDKDILFLYLHNKPLDFGKTLEWMSKVVINKVANRNRKGLPTILLSEKKFSEIQNCGEFDIITLKSSKEGTSVKDVSEVHSSGVVY